MPSAVSAYLAECLLTEWDARDIAQSDNTEIASWPISAASSEGNPLAQSTANRRPLFRAGTYPYAQYDGTNDVLFANLVTDPEVVFFVFETTIDATLRALGSCLSGSNYWWAYLGGSTFTNQFVGTTPAPAPNVAWNAAQNAVRQVIAIITKSTSCGFMMSRSGNQAYITAKPSFAGAITVGGFNSGITYPYTGNIHYVATCAGMSLEKIRHAMAVIAEEWGVTFDAPEDAGGGSTLIVIED
jgi:hypothetical protein